MGETFVQKMENAPVRKRLFYMDLLRAIACLSVVMIHVSAEFVVRGTTGPDFILGNLLDSLSRAGVPLFVMISGALMLDEKYEFTKKKWLGHIAKMAAFFFVWSSVYFVLYNDWGLVARGKKLKALKVLAQILSGHYHLWFVPMILGIYLIVPLLRLWVKEKNVKHVRYFLILSTVVSFIIPQLDGMQILVGGTFWENMNLQYTALYPTYFILGWYLNRGVKHSKLVIGLGVFGFLMTFVGTHLAATLLNLKYPFYENFTVNVLLYSAGIFVLCRELFVQGKEPGRMLRGTVNWIGKCSLGIYAVHVYMISKLMWLIDGMHAAAAIPALFVMVFASSMLISMVLKMIPMVKKIV